jgi:hypothetical protein
MNSIHEGSYEHMYSRKGRTRESKYEHEHIKYNMSEKNCIRQHKNCERT